MCIFYAKNRNKQTIFAWYYEPTLFCYYFKSLSSVMWVAKYHTQCINLNHLNFNLNQSTIMLIENSVVSFHGMEWKCIKCMWNNMQTPLNIVVVRRVLEYALLFLFKALKLNKKNIIHFIVWRAIVLRRKDFILPILSSNKSLLFIIFFIMRENEKVFLILLGRGSFGISIGKQMWWNNFFCVSSFGTHYIYVR